MMKGYIGRNIIDILLKIQDYNHDTDIQFIQISISF